MEKTINEIVSLFKTLPFREMQRVHELLYREIQQCDEIKEEQRYWQEYIRNIEKNTAKLPKKSREYCRGVTYESVFPLVDKDYHGKPYFNIYDCDGNPIF